jgi:hypothetical protein
LDQHLNMEASHVIYECWQLERDSLSSSLLKAPGIFINLPDINYIAGVLFSTAAVMLLFAPTPKTNPSPSHSVKVFCIKSRHVQCMQLYLCSFPDAWYGIWARRQSSDHHH